MLKKLDLKAATTDLDLIILYGSQLGQAKSIAENLVSGAEACGLKAKEFSLNDVTDPETLVKTEKPLVIVTSTTGDGDPPENADKFWRKIRRKTLSSTTLLGLRYTILGLGDTNYNNFCNCGKTVHERLQDLGATLFYSPGWADDAVGIELVVDDWIQGLWPALRRACGAPKVTALTSTKNNTVIAIAEQQKETDVKMVKNEDTPAPTTTPVAEAPVKVALSVPALPQLALDITFSESASNENIPFNAFQPPAPYPLIDGSPFFGDVTNVEVLTKPGSLKTTLELTLTFENEVEFLPGDAFSIISPNPPSEVDAILKRLKLESKADVNLNIKLNTSVPKAKMPPHLPSTTTLRNALTHFCDIRQPPKKLFIRLLAEHTADEGEKAELLELCSKQGATAYTENILNPGVSILDLLLKYPSCNPPQNALLEHLPRLLPRPYSVCSSPLASKSSIKIAFNVIEIPNDHSQRKYARLGVCTGYLLHLCKTKFPDKLESAAILEEESGYDLGGDSTTKLVVFKRKNQNFEPPSDVEKPVVMVGPGTGIAPFIGFLQHRQLQRATSGPEHVESETGSYTLYFGCRNKATDYLYETELANYVKSTTLEKLYVAFSRDEDSNEGLRYVQHLMLQNKEEIVSSLIDGGGYLYVCGDAKNMAKEVRETLIQCVADVKGLELKDAMTNVAVLVTEKRYLQDVWA